jgi:hypothetical protein
MNNESTIWKFELELYEMQLIEMPKASIIRHVGMQQECRMCLWAEVNPSAEKAKRKIAIRGTGCNLSGMEGKYIGTVVDDRAARVWHIYDGGEC